jgi:hypothetical protein
MSGRPSEFTLDIAAQICAGIESGLSLVKVCEAEDMPHRSTIYDWLARQEPEFKAFADKYARAVEARAEKLAEEIITIADDDKGDYGYKEASDKDGEGAKPCILPDNIQRAKLRVDARKWIACKLFPKKYGDKVQAEHTGAEGGPIAFAVTVNYVKPSHGPVG